MELRKKHVKLPSVMDINVRVDALATLEANDFVPTGVDQSQILDPEIKK